MSSVPPALRPIMQGEGIWCEMMALEYRHGERRVSDAASLYQLYRQDESDTQL